MAETKLGKEELAVFKKRLSENMPILVSRTEAGETERFPCVLYGSIGDELLIIGAVQNMPLAINESIIVRLAIGNHLIGFQTQVIKEIKNPSIYLVRFPFTIEAINLRKSDRVQAFFPAEVTSKSDEVGNISVLQTRILDISAGGCCFGSKTKLPLNSEISISFSLPGQRQIHSLKAAILASTLSGKAYINRARFVPHGANLSAIKEIESWINDSLTFAAKT